MSSGLFRTVATAAVAMLTAVVAAGSASADVVYDNIPGPLPGNLPSLGYEATSTSEFGGLVQLAGTARNNASISVTLSSWGCESGSGTTCVTTPGATFDEPITLKVYDVDANGVAKHLVAAETQTFHIPFRPSADTGNCSGGAWYQASTDSCFNGKAVTVTFPALTTTLPDQAIFSLAYDTTHYGASPQGEGQACFPGCGYDSLNVALTGAPTVGSLPRGDDAYLSSTWSGAFCDGTLGVGSFRLDAGCWTGYQPAIRVATPSPLPAGGAPVEQQVTSQTRPVASQQASANAAPPAVQPPSPRVVCASVPTLLRHTYRGAKGMLKRAGCNVVLHHKGHAKHGKSHVKSQSQAAGTVLHDGDVLRVRLG